MAHVARLPLGRANGFLISDEQSILVDTGFLGNWVRLRRSLSDHGIRPVDLSLVVITHAHHDHLGNLAALKREADVAIAAHANAAPHLVRGTSAEIHPRSWQGRAVAMFLKDQPRIPGVDVEFRVAQEMSLCPFGVHGCVVPTPGHTDGCLSVLLDDGQAVVGDLIMGGFVRSRAPRAPLFMCSKADWADSVRVLLDRGATRFYTGHGGPFDRDEIADLLRLEP